jgi:arylsulfatase
VRWPGHFPAETTLNGIVSHEGWLPTLAAVAGDGNVREELGHPPKRLEGRLSR